MAWVTSADTLARMNEIAEKLRQQLTANEKAVHTTACRLRSYQYRARRMSAAQKPGYFLTRFFQEGACLKKLGLVQSANAKQAETQRRSKNGPDPHGAVQVPTVTEKLASDLGIDSDTVQRL
jgi:hypothetical protein